MTNYAQLNAGLQHMANVGANLLDHQTRQRSLDISQQNADTSRGYLDEQVHQRRMRETLNLAQSTYGTLAARQAQDKNYTAEQLFDDMPDLLNQIVSYTGDESKLNERVKAAGGKRALGPRVDADGKIRLYYEDANGNEVPFTGKNGQDLGISKRDALQSLAIKAAPAGFIDARETMKAYAPDDPALLQMQQELTGQIKQYQQQTGYAPSEGMGLLMEGDLLAELEGFAARRQAAAQAAPEQPATFNSQGGFGPRRSEQPAPAPEATPKTVGPFARSNSLREGVTPQKPLDQLNQEDFDNMAARDRTAVLQQAGVGSPDAEADDGLFADATGPVTTITPSQLVRKPNVTDAETPEQITAQAEQVVNQQQDRPLTDQQLTTVSNAMLRRFNVTPRNQYSDQSKEARSNRAAAKAYFDMLTFGKVDQDAVNNLLGGDDASGMTAKLYALETEQMVAMAKLDAARIKAGGQAEVEDLKERRKINRERTKAEYKSLYENVKGRFANEEEVQAHILSAYNKNAALLRGMGYAENFYDNDPVLLEKFLEAANESARLHGRRDGGFWGTDIGSTKLNTKGELTKALFPPMEAGIFQAKLWAADPRKAEALKRIVAHYEGDMKQVYTHIGEELLKRNGTSSQLRQESPDE